MRKFVLITLLGLLASTAQAHRPGGPIDKTCASGCREARHACLSTTRDTARACVTATCAPQLDALRTACTADPASAECRTAGEVLRACGMPCLEVLRTSLKTCRDSGGSCFGQCPSASPRPEPSACVLGCRSAFSTCRTAARETAAACQAGCADEITAARDACDAPAMRHHGHAAPPSEACRAARVAVRTCLAPCAEGQHAAIEACSATASGCVAQCN